MLVISINELRPGFSTMPAYDTRGRVIIHIKKNKDPHLKARQFTFQQELQVEDQARFDTCLNKRSEHLFQAPKN
jgi:hypothetical protein